MFSPLLDREHVSAALDLPSRYARVRLGLSLRARDPLAFWHFGVERVREAFKLFVDSTAPIDELHLRSCNKGTKTESAAAYVLACLQKRRDLDGVPIPRWQGRVEGLCGVLDYKQQLLSVQPAYERLLGEWPYKTRKLGETLQTLWVRALDSTDDVRTWSVLHFLTQENRKSGTGARADICHFDEPPVMPILRELRKAGHARRPALIVIGETPTIRSQWAELREDYGDTPRSTLRRVDEERAECRWSLDEVADWVLPPAEKAKLKRKYRNDPLRDAREHGDYAITEGGSPWGIDGQRALEQMLAACTDPIEFQEFPLQVEPGARARIIRLEVFRRPDDVGECVVAIDPSSGVEDKAHDPYELEVTEVESGDLVARVGGYLSGFLVGMLGAAVCRWYHDAWADPEVNDRWGVNVVEGFHAAGYSKFARERRELRPGEWSNEIGFHNTGVTRPLIIGSTQRWLEAWSQGKPYGRCPSRFVINTLLDTILDENGKPVAAPGFHDEALICRGQSLRRCMRRPPEPKPEPTDLERAAAEQVIGWIKGKPVEGQRGVSEYLIPRRH